MAGTYNGPDFGGATTWFEEVTGRTEAQRQQAHANIFAASDGGTRRVVSADGERVLFEPWRHTTGPARRQVGASSSSGSGAVGVGAASGVGPGNIGAKLVSSVGAFGPVLTVPGPYEVKLQESNRTPIMVGGQWVAQDHGWSDAGDFEERYGEGELFSPSWFAGWGVAAADGRATLGRMHQELGRAAEPHRSAVTLPGTYLASPEPDAWPPAPSPVFLLPEYAGP